MQDKPQTKRVTVLPKVKRRQNNYESALGIKLDYSEAYFENDMLNHDLQNRLAWLHKKKFRHGVECEDNLKAARKAAGDIQKLSQAIKKGEVPDSYSLLKGDTNSNSSSILGKEKSDRVTDKNVRLKVEELCTDVRRINTRDSDTEDDDDESSEHTEDRAKPINTLTMFALSLQKFSSSLNRHPTNDQKQQSEAKNAQNRTQSAKTVRRAFDRSRLERRPKMRRALTARIKPVKDGEVLEASDCQPTVVYDIPKSKASRSRRQLQEISQLEQKEKFGDPDSNEERKRVLQNWIKGDGQLEHRIRTFINDCDHFNKQNKPMAFPIQTPRRMRTFFC